MLKKVTSSPALASSVRRSLGSVNQNQTNKESPVPSRLSSQAQKARHDQVDFGRKMFGRSNSYDTLLLDSLDPVKSIHNATSIETETCLRIDLKEPSTQKNDCSVQLNFKGNPEGTTTEISGLCLAVSESVISRPASGTASNNTEALEAGKVDDTASAIFAYRQQFDVSFLQELLSSLEVVERKARSISTEPSGIVDDLAGMCQFMSNSFIRAAKRVSNLAHGSSKAHLSIDSFLTLVEYGYVDLLTLDKELAATAKFLEAEQLDPTTDAVLFHQRIDPLAPWDMVGAASQRSADMQLLLQNDGGNEALCAAKSIIKEHPFLSYYVCKLVLERGSSLLGFADVLLTVGEALKKAQGQLQEWAKGAMASSGTSACQQAVTA